MDYTLRPYQERIIGSIMTALPVDEAILVQAATGAGKTIVFSELIRRLLASWPGLRIAVLAHRRELIRQAADKLRKVWPDSIRHVGLACASTGASIDVDMPVTIGSIQTLSNRVQETAPFDLIIVDEAHRLPPVNEKSQYGEWLEVMQKYNRNVRILGFTATPFRLGHGYIYGPMCRPGHENLFPFLHEHVSISELQREGFLCGYRAKEVVSMAADLSSVALSGGDYNLGKLSELMSQKRHVGSAVEAVKEYAKDRKRIVVFACTIEHAETLQKAFSKAEFSSAVVHSKMHLGQRDMALAQFERGNIRVLVNVGVLTEGWDSPAVDCVVQCRPTKSPALYVQITGRGLRIWPEKADVLILDLANNCTEHGDPNSPKIIVPGRPVGKAAKDFIKKKCPECREIVQPQTMKCPACGYEWPRPEVADVNDAQRLQDVLWKQSAPETMEVTVEEVVFEDFTSKKGNRMLKCRLVTKLEGSFVPYIVNHFFDVEGNASEFSFRRSRHTWRAVTGCDPDEIPETIEAAMEDEGLFKLMLEGAKIEIVLNGKFWNVHKWQVANAAPRPAIAVGQDFDDDIPF